MYLRQTTAGLIKRIRFPSQTKSISKSICERPPNASNSTSSTLLGKINISNQYGRGDSTGRIHAGGLCIWFFFSGQAIILYAINANPVFAKELHSENDTGGADITGFRRIEDGSVVSNVHTSKWRVFTDKGRDLFHQGKLEEAENYFLLALQEAKEGFGERDPHVASSCNNLAELYRVRKAFDKAEPLYLEAINILEESFSPEDIRVGVACHNIGQFYLVQRKLEEARICYERALKIKGRVLGYGHTDYADTMYHLGTVLYLQGKEKDSEVLIQDSIRILEEGGQRESTLFIRRLRHLAQMYLKSNRLAEAENVHRKILHILELSKGWNSLDTVIAAEGLALTLQSNGNLMEAQELLERCLEARKTLLPEDHIQIGANILHIARVVMLNSNHLSNMDVSKAIAELDKAKDLLGNSARIARQVLYRSTNKTNKKYGEYGQNQKDKHAALVILLQSLDALGILEITKHELQESMEHLHVEAKNAFHECITSFKEFELQKPMSESPEVKTAYLSCLKHLSSIISDDTPAGTHKSRRTNVQELKDEIKHIEAEVSQYRKQRS